MGDVYPRFGAGIHPLMIAPTTRTTTRTAARRLPALVAVAALTLAACGDDAEGDTDTDIDTDVVADEEQQDAQPTPGSAGFTEGDFDDIPIARGATEISEKTERDGAISQSFTATATSPEQIMEFYTSQLAELGWQEVEAVRETGTDSLAAAWVSGNDRLEISALLAQGVEDEQTQFSIVLLPDRTAGEEINDAETDDGETDDG